MRDFIFLLSIKRIVLTIAAIFFAQSLQAEQDVLSSILDPAPKTSTPLVATRLQTLKVISIEHDDLWTLMNFKFDQSISWDKPVVEKFDGYIQLRMSQTILAEPGKSYESKSPYVSKIIGIQADPYSTLIRIYVKGPERTLVDHLNFEVLNDRLAVSLDHKSLATALNQAQIPATAVSLESSDPAARAQVVVQEQVNETTEVNSTSIGGTTAVGKNSWMRLAGSISKDRSMRQKIYTAVWFMGGMLLLWGLSRGWRRVALGILPLHKRPAWLRGGRSNQGAKSALEEQRSQLRILNKLSLGSREQLALIEAGGQTLLLAVSRDKISFLAAVAEPVPLQKLSRLDPSTSHPLLKTTPTPLATHTGLQKNLLTETKNVPPVKGKPIHGSDNNLARPQVDEELELRMNSPQKRGAIDDVTELIRSKIRKHQVSA